MARWDKQRRSDNVKRVGGSGGGAAGAGLIFMLIRFIFGRFGIMGIVLLVGGYFVLSFMGVDPLRLVGGMAPSGGQTSAPQPSAYDDRVAAVAGSTEDVWNRLFRENNLEGGEYPEPGVILYTKGVNSGCGYAPSAVGPFYCPADQRIYLDTSFFDDLRTRFRVQGDFPGDYVMAHEVGHHVQHVTGIIEEANRAKRGQSEVIQNQLQVRIELQADCFAGLWANEARGNLEPGDIEEALNAAEAIGDDRLQRQAGQTVNPDTFTHGTSAQRMAWFRQGFDNGSLAACDTFSQPYSAL